MKTQIPIASRTKRHDKGFALVVTLSLMILLTVIAVGLLGLSSVSLRTSSQQVSMSEARANARLALMLALGDLQKYAGPDQRITATADILTGTDATKKKYTGVWEANKIEPGKLPTKDDYPTETDTSPIDNKFQAWLASSKLTNKDDNNSGNSPAFNKSAPTDSIELWSANTVGTADKIAASRIKMTNANNVSVGRFAYAVTDEGVKARINTPLNEDAVINSAKIAQLGSGQRASSRLLPGTGSKLTRDLYINNKDTFLDLAKGISRNNHTLATEIVASGSTANFKNLYHDITSLSSSVMADVASGRLKQDFNLLADNDLLPAEYAGQRVYQSILGKTASDSALNSDPHWQSLHEIAKFYRDRTKLSRVAGSPTMQATAPAGWEAKTSDKNPPSGVVLMPNLVKVEVIYSLIARDIYYYPGGRDGRAKPSETIDKELALPGQEPHKTYHAGSPFDYLLQMMYTPVVTLHNPYNIPLRFDSLNVEFAQVPFSFKINRISASGVVEAQHSNFLPLDYAYLTTANQANNVANIGNKKFGMTLQADPTQTGSKIITLLPGEVKLFSPWIDPDSTWANRAGDETGDMTLSAKAIATAGFRGDGVGFIADALWPGAYRSNLYPGNKELGGLADGQHDPNNPTAGTGRRQNCIPLRADDSLTVEFTPLGVPNVNKFTVEMRAKPAGGSAAVKTSIVEINYGDASGLQKELLNGAGASIKYPNPDPNSGQPSIPVMQIYSYHATRLKDTVFAPFATISMQAKTTHGGFNNETLGGVEVLDGLHASKPWAFGHSVVATSSIQTSMEDNTKAHPVWGSHNVNIARLDQGTSSLKFDSVTGRGRFLSGFTGKGSHFGVTYEIPVTPLQSLTSLNAANPGGASSILPRFTYPIGNSWAHPMLPSDQIAASAADGERLDHSFLLNRALYDRFYFSGLSSLNKGIFGETTHTQAFIAQNFLDGKPLIDPRFKLYVPNGTSVSNFVSNLSLPSLYERVASWQMLSGGFNINSTSVEAWKAMLSSIDDPNPLVMNGLNKKLDPLNSASISKEARIGRFRLPVDVNAGDLETYWLGSRKYTDAEITSLATEIVKQVKSRGPFLSLSDFVNRQIGTGIKSQKGALQHAIDDAKVNEAVAVKAEVGYNIPDAKVLNHRYSNQDAAIGPSYQGAPGYLSQADIMSVLGNAATPRSDTFTIRGYGESMNKSGSIVARAYCEAVVQRVPDYVDTADQAHVPSGILTSEANKKFGRKFIVMSFRWLNPTEV